MSTPWRRTTMLGIALIIAAALGAGYVIGALNGSHQQVFVGSGYVGDDVASLQAGDTWYGLRSSVSWTDSNGAFHANGWPDCLPHLEQVVGIRFAGETRWVGDVGTAEVTWVDCLAP